MGKHLKIENQGIETLYAHCSKILVKENDYVEIGQEIANVGSTGNSTGPHLHFEIMYLGKYIDPSKLVDF
ncbi:MAG: M23 family metallopeptidase [Clostridia bacterium]|nr:M23 family metallopeptidase [Clostridia bacterium]